MKSMAGAAMLGSAAVAPVPGPGGSAIAQPATTTPFVAPSGPVLLTREVHRGLPGGAEIVTRRTYAVTFSPQDNGWRVDGELRDSQIDAPEELAMLAALERSRKDVGMFPLFLDAEGQIVEQHGSGDETTASRARAIVTSAVGRIPLSPDDRNAARAMVQRIAAQSQSAGGNWPSDLFRPAATHQTEERTMALPDGTQGRISISVSAREEGNGRVEQLERRVVTELAGTRRTSSEVFRVERLP